MILLTGASGVLGAELVKRLDPANLILARHRADPGAGARQVKIDIRQPRLGLEPAAYHALADTVDVVVHAAAVTDMGGAAEGLLETNVEGVGHVVDFAKTAGAMLHAVSTAYCAEDYGPKRPVDSAYVRSKRAAEALVRDSGVDWTLIRPSIVAGHSMSGEIARFQGFHMFIAAILKGRLPIIPLDPEAQCDFVPADIAAAATNAILAAPEPGRTYWLTAGDRALTIADMLETGQPAALEMGRNLDDLIFADPETIEQTHIPSLGRRLPRRLRERLDTLMELSSVMATEQPFPSDLSVLLPHKSLDQSVLRRALLANIEFWRSGSKA
ncbi:MAG: SDR family oxidoreductase [Pseudomonadota bacterium]